MISVSPSQHTRHRETLGQFLQRSREALPGKMTQSEIARRAKLANSTISRLENDQTREPPMETLIRIASHYGVSVLDLWDRAGYMSRPDAVAFVELLNQIEPLTLVHLGLQRLGLPVAVREFVERAIQDALATYQQRANDQG